MRKVYNLLALVMLLFTGASAVQAQSRYQITDGDITMPIAADAIETGVNYVLENGSVSANQTYDFVSGAAKTSILTDDNLYQFEAAGENANGEAVYRLKRVSTSEYLENNSGSMSYTTTQARAWKFRIVASVTTNEEDLNNTENPVHSDFSELTLSSPIGDAVILYDAEGDASVKGGGWMFCTNGEGKSASFSKSDYTTNVLCIYTVEELTGYAYLQDALTALGVIDGVSDKYNPGTEPGNISQDLYDEMVAAWDACNELITNLSDDQEACVAALTRLNNALAAAKAGVILVKEGYYYFGGNRTAADENGYSTNATYDNDGYVTWTYQSTWTHPDVLDIDNAKYVWQIIQAGTNEETGEATYYIRNLYTQRYIGVVHQKNTYVPSTVAPESAYYIYPRTKNDFSIESVELREDPAEGWDGVKCTALHQMGDGNKIVVWSPSADASGWIFMNVSQEEVDAVMTQIDQDKINKTAESLLTEAEASYQKGFAYPLVGGKESGELDSDEEGNPLGLVTKISQVSTNSLETSEGSLEALLDNDITDKNFYHSIWNSSVATEAGFDNTTTYPYLQFDLEQAVEEITLKMWPRRNGSDLFTSNLPGKVHVLATNGDPTDESAWVEIGNFNSTLNWKYISSPEGTTTSSNQVAALRLPLGAAYRYVRVEVCTRYNSTADFKSLGLSQACYNMGELRVFQSGYSAEASLNSAVPADVLNEFIAAKEALQAEVDAESATQAAIDRLQAAYDNYLNNYPDPTLVTDDLAAAQTVHDNAEEGEELGYYAEGSKDELQAALDAVKATVKDVMTVDEVKEARAAIANALAQFGGKLNVPTEGSWYYLVSKTTAAASNAYVYSAGNGVARNKWSKMDDDANFSSNLAYFWQFVKKADGTYALKNALNGEYLNTPRASGKGAGMAAADTASFSLVSPKGGIFNLVFDNSVYLNAEATGNMVTWNEATAEDNSAFAFEEADIESNWDGSQAVNVAANKVTIITLPISVKSDGSCYSVIGRNGENLELAAIAANEVIEAGTPFFYVEESGETSAILEAVEDATSLTYATEAKTVNGLVGTLAPIDELHVGYGILYSNESIVDSEPGEGVSNNSGYIIPSVPSTTESGDKQVKIDGKIDAINTVAPAQEASVVSVYTLSGVKVRTNVKAVNATNGLPAGLYIVGQKKVLVK